MTELEIFNSNKLIAEFMGFEIKNNKIIYDPSDVPPDELLIGWCLCNLKYHCDWNWLMPVVDKISNLPHVSITLMLWGYANIKIKEHDDDYEEIIYNITMSSFSIQFLWRSIIEFIKWYNSK